MGPAAPCGKKRDATPPFSVTLSAEVNEIIPVAGNSDHKVCDHEEEF